MGLVQAVQASNFCTKCGHSAPATQDCLQALTICIILSLSGKTNPWVSLALVMIIWGFLDCPEKEDSGYLHKDEKCQEREYSASI